jgi:hypothetical protein
VFRFGYERFELRARLGPGNLEHAIAAAAEVAPASLRDGRTKRWRSRSGFALARTECLTRPARHERLLAARPCPSLWTVGYGSN